jgi:hypothetical protein
MSETSSYTDKTPPSPQSELGKHNCVRIPLPAPTIYWVQFSPLFVGPSSELDGENGNSPKFPVYLVFDADFAYSYSVCIMRAC